MRWARLRMERHRLSTVLPFAIGQVTVLLLFVGPPFYGVAGKCEMTEKVAKDGCTVNECQNWSQGHLILRHCEKLELRCNDRVAVCAKQFDCTCSKKNKTKSDPTILFRRETLSCERCSLESVFELPRLRDAQDCGSLEPDRKASACVADALKRDRSFFAQRLAADGSRELFLEDAAALSFRVLRIDPGGVCNARVGAQTCARIKVEADGGLECSAPSDGTVWCDEAPTFATTLVQGPFNADSLRCEVADGGELLGCHLSEEDGGIAAGRFRKALWCTQFEGDRQMQCRLVAP